MPQPQQQFPTTVQGAVIRLKARFRDRETNELVDMTDGSALVRVVNAADSVVLGDVACTIAGTDVYYDWNTDGVAVGTYRVQFSGTPDSGTLFIEPAEALRVCIVRRIGG